MPFNLLKDYPDLLELDHLSDFERTKSLKGVYARDIENNGNFYFRDKRIYPIKSDGRIDMDRQFTHLTCEEKEEADENGKLIFRRVFDKYRSERLHWIKKHTSEAVQDGIVVFSLTERDIRKRMDVVRTYIYNRKQKYVIVFEPQKRNGASYYLLTAYYLNRNYGVKQMEKKLKNKMIEVL